MFSAQGASAATAPVGGTETVIVEGTAGGAALVRSAVERLGGTVQARLDIIDGVRATVPVGGVALLAGAPGVLEVSPDSTLVPLKEKWGDDTTGQGVQATAATGTWSSAGDLGSMYTAAKTIGAQAVWAKKDPNNTSQTLTGHGVGVALIDTGVAPVEGLLTAGKIVNGPDLSFESQSVNTRYVDGFGHGTHMAGIIAGKDTAVKTGKESDPANFVGIAPDATIVNVKVAAADGGVDVSQVIAGIDWVVTNKAKNNIRVINLSYGTESTQSAALDPLAHAVESAWRNGIVVVVAAGNDGESGTTPLTMPAIDPFVIAVGSVDYEATGLPAALRVGAWTSTGTAARRPDLVAPGKSVVSLRVPGSFADVSHPEGLIAGDTARWLFRGTGTSQSAAVVSGAIALLLERNPALTPDQVKGLLKANADPLIGDPSAVQGSGEIDINRAVVQLETGKAIPAYTQTAVHSTGLGSLDASRGASFVTDPATLTTLRGEQDVFGVAWNPATWAPASTAGTAWVGGTWRGSAWITTPALVASTTLAASTTTATATGWASRSWSGVLWSSRSWSTMTFLSRSWSGSDWTSRSWSADHWDSRSWSTDFAW